MKRGILVPVIYASNFILRPFHIRDVLSLQRNINHPDVARKVSYIPYPYTLDHARQWINGTEYTVNSDSKRVDFAIDKDGEVIGSVAFINLDFHKAQVSSWLGKDFWGNGTITEAMKKLVQFGFEEMDLIRIYAYVYPENKASRRVLEKVGFEFEGVLRKEWYKRIDGEDCFFDSHYYALIREGEVR